MQAEGRELPFFDSGHRSSQVVDNPGENYVDSDADGPVEPVDNAPDERTDGTGTARSTPT
jgi:hypothetical protein